MAFKKELVETEPEKVTATEDDSGTDSAEEYGDASDGTCAPARLESRVLGERAEKTVTGENTLGETLTLDLGTKTTNSSELSSMTALDDSSI